MDTLLGATIEGGDDLVKKSVEQYYGETLTTSADLKTSACCTPGGLPTYLKKCLRVVPDEIKANITDAGRRRRKGSKV